VSPEVTKLFRAIDRVEDMADTEERISSRTATAHREATALMLALWSELTAAQSRDAYRRLQALGTRL
jgi:hypothetical protein